MEFSAFAESFYGVVVLVWMSGDLLHVVRFLTVFQPSVEFSHVLVLSITETVLFLLI